MLVVLVRRPSQPNWRWRGQPTLRLQLSVRSNLEATAKDLSQAARYLRSLSELLEKRPTALIVGTNTDDRFFKNFPSLCYSIGNPVWMHLKWTIYVDSFTCWYRICANMRPSATLRMGARSASWTGRMLKYLLCCRVRCKLTAARSVNDPKCTGLYASKPV